MRCSLGIRLGFSVVLASLALVSVAQVDCSTSSTPEVSEGTPAGDEDSGAPGTGADSAISEDTGSPAADTGTAADSGTTTEDGGLDGSVDASDDGG
jgi:hypothetical protein